MKKSLYLIFSLSILLAACGHTGNAVSTRTHKGVENAVVTVVEYADLQCPACARAHSTVVGPLLEQYSNKIRYEHMHFPLQTIHRYAVDAAIASECAADQGKFWEYLDIAFTNQSELSDEALVNWAEQLGLDVSAFRSCQGDRSKRDIVMNDYKTGRGMEVNSTPTFFVNGTKVTGTFDALSDAIDEELKRLAGNL